MFFKSKDFKELHPINIPIISSNLIVFDSHNFNSVNDSQLANIKVISTTFSKLKFVKSIFFKEDQPENKSPISSTFLVSKLLKSIEVKEKHPENISLISTTLEVSKFDK